jgi:hypothetical protein
MVAVSQQRGLVHQHGPNVREPLSQPVQDREPVRVDVTPVDQVKVGQPAELLQ